MNKEFKNETQAIKNWLKEDRKTGKRQYSFAEKVLINNIDFLNRKQGEEFIKAFPLSDLMGENIINKLNLLYQETLPGGDATNLTALQNYHSLEEPMRWLHCLELCKLLYVKKIPDHKFNEKYHQCEVKLVELEGESEKVKQAIQKNTRIIDKAGEEDVLGDNIDIFEKQAEQHGKNAKAWQKWIYGTVGILMIVIVLFFFIQNRINQPVIQVYVVTIDGVFIIKFAISVGIAQVLRFFTRNYNAEKHLQQTALHRANILKSVLGIYKNLNEEAYAELRKKLLFAAGLMSFHATETGFISRKEGAGNTINLADVIKDVK